MKPTTLLFLISVGFILFLTGSVDASGKKPPPFLLRVHAETTAKDGDLFSVPVVVGNPPVKVHVEKMPMIAERDIEYYYPFQSQYGLGAYFKLNAHGTKAYEAVTASQKGKFLVIVFNGRPLFREVVTRPVTDGIVMVRDGISQEEMFRIGQSLKQIGESDAAAQARRRQELAIMKQRQSQEE